MDAMWADRALISPSRIIFACDPSQNRKSDSLLSCDHHNDAQDSGVPTSFAEMRRNCLSSCPTKFSSLSTIRALACRIVLGKPSRWCLGYFLVS